jgi:hypothetical protein
LYVADDSSASNHGGIQKWELINGSWTAEGVAAPGSSVRGITGLSDGTNVTLFAATGGGGATGGGSLYSFVDTTGALGVISGPADLIATAASNEAFRGVAFAPVAIPEPSCLLLAGTGLFLALGYRHLRSRPVRSS